MRRYLSVQEAMPVCFTVFLPTDVVVINDILFFGLSNGFRIMQNSSWTRCRHKPKVELKCFCNCFWLPVVANVSRIQSFAESWEISRLTFKAIEVHHDTLVCGEARFRRLATSTQPGCFIQKHLTWRLFLLDESVLILQWMVEKQSLSVNQKYLTQLQRPVVVNRLTCAKLQMNIQQNLELKIHTIHQKQPCICGDVVGKNKNPNWECSLHDFSLLPERSGLVEVQRGRVSGFRSGNLMAFRSLAFDVSFLNIAGWHESVVAGATFFCWHLLARECDRERCRCYACLERDFKFIETVVVWIYYMYSIQYNTIIFRIYSLRFQ